MTRKLQTIANTFSEYHTSRRRAVYADYPAFGFVLDSDQYWRRSGLDLALLEPALQITRAGSGE
jgi:hypothetical protein